MPLTIHRSEVLTSLDITKDPPMVLTTIMSPKTVIIAWLVLTTMMSPKTHL